MALKKVRLEMQHELIEAKRLREANDAMAKQIELLQVRIEESSKR